MSPADLTLTICPGPAPEAATMPWATGWSTFILEGIYHQDFILLPSLNIGLWMLTLACLSYGPFSPLFTLPSFHLPPNFVSYLLPSLPSFSLTYSSSSLPISLPPPSSLTSLSPILLSPPHSLLFPSSLPSFSLFVSLSFSIHPSCLEHSLYVRSWAELWKLVRGRESLATLTRNSSDDNPLQSNICRTSPPV